MFRKMFEEHWQRQKRWDKYLEDGKYVLQFAIYLLIGMALSWTLFWPTHSLVYRGLSVDSAGRVYIGEQIWIGVYENGELVDKIIQSSHGNFYEFTIVDEQIHMWGGSGSHWVLDMDGNRLRGECKIHDNDGLSMQEKREFIAEDGRFYELENGLLKRAKVTCYHPDGSEEIVFQMPLGLYLTKLAFFVYLAALALWLGRAFAWYRRGEAESKADLYKY